MQRLVLCCALVALASATVPSALLKEATNAVNGYTTEGDHHDACEACVGHVAGDIMKHVFEHIEYTCAHANTTQEKEECDWMKTHPNMTAGMLVERVEPGHLAYAYCIGARACHPQKESLASLNLADQGVQFSALAESVSVVPNLRQAVNAENCTACVEGADVAEIKSIVSHIEEECKNTKCPVFKKRCEFAKEHPHFALGFLIAKVEPSKYGAGLCVGEKLCKSPFELNAAYETAVEQLKW